MFKTRFISMLVLLCLTVSGAWADDSGSCGTSLTYSYVESTHTLTISGTGAMDDFDYGAPWSAYQDNITSVVIEDGVTSVGARAFTWCSNLTSVSLPASLEAIGAMAFARCGLTSITLPASLETIGMRAFQDTKITSVNIPASVASIDELAFGYCGSLAEITVADGNTVYEAPNGCNALIVKATHTLIQGCNGTVFANLPADLKSIGEAAFAGCTSLTTVTFPDGLESIGGNAFESCSGLTTVTIPASVNTVDVNAFAWCDNLTTVTIYATSLTTYGEGAFDDAASGLKIYVPYGSGDTYKAGWADYASKIEEMAAPATYTVTLKEGTEDADKWTIEPNPAQAGQTVTATYGGTKKVKSVKAVKKAPAGTPLDNTTTAWTAGTFAVPAGGLTYSDAITVSGDVTLVLTDGETLTLNKGISLASGATLTIQGNGTMNVNGTNESTASTVAGTGTLVLTSGTLNAKGGNGQGVGDQAVFTDNRANAGGNAINGNVTVSGGTLTATGGNGGGVGAMSAKSYGAVGGEAISGSVTVTGGAVTATGGNGGSIGNMGAQEYGGAGGAAIGGDATISGGTWTATDGTHGVNGDGQGGDGGKAVAGTVTDNRS